MRLILAAASIAVLLPSCPEPRPVAPKSGNGTIPWNPPQPGQGAGAFGAIPQQPRR
jgi:hypothetical protein